MSVRIVGKRPRGCRVETIVKGEGRFLAQSGRPVLMSVGAPCLSLIDMQERSISEGEDEMKVEGLKTLHPRKRAQIRIKRIIETTVVTRRKPLVG
jgi:hypothetical protein